MISIISRLSFTNPAHQHAIVIGGSMAGMCVARVLTDYFQHVTVIERDVPPHERTFRKGVPQARHAHVLLKGGELALEQLFPGLRQELADNGALMINAGSDVALQLLGQWRQPYPSTIDVLACSRPLLEHALYRRLSAHSRVTFVHDCEVVGLCTDERQTQVTGLELRPRNGHASEDAIIIEASLVVDASGRGSRAPQWLEALGYTPPVETTVSAQAGYASRIYQCPPEFSPGWKALSIIPAAPAATRGGVILPMEGDRWHVTLVGMAGDYPPTDEAAFLAFARSLPNLQLYMAILRAQPLSDIWGARNLDNRLRDYAKLPRHLEGFLVCGDSVYALNPIYAQGMTVGALSALAIGQCIHEQRRAHPNGDLRGLAQRVQARIGKVVAGPWQLATGEDRRWPTTEGAEPLPLPARLIQQYVGQLLHTMLTDATVAEVFTRVQQMIAPPTLFFRLDILLRVLAAGMRRRQRATRALDAGQPETALSSD
jgi:2-polyprenyl-6-methoxyphenol hydroxylase-like FAD-dependent oxidoreductase